MIVKSFLFAFLFTWGTLFAEKPPNIVFVLADDLGYMDIAAFAAREWGVNREVCYYETPHLDQLVDEGVAFSNFYACQLCSPTRASILTGKNAAVLGVTTATPFRRTYYNSGQEKPEGYSPHDVLEHKDSIKEEQAWDNGLTNTAVPDGAPTLPQVLKTHHSAFLGKWYFGGGMARLTSRRRMPVFRSWRGSMPGARLISNGDRSGSGCRPISIAPTSVPTKWAIPVPRRASAI
jgi:hypothetical protein